MTLPYCRCIEAKVLKCIRKHIVEEIYCLNISGESELILEGTQLLKESYLFRNVLTSMEVDLKQKLTF